VEMKPLKYHPIMLIITEIVILFHLIGVGLTKYMYKNYEYSLGFIVLLGGLIFVITQGLIEKSIFYIPRDHPQKDRIETTMRRIGIFNIGLGIILTIMYFLL